ncbi:MULTISPECIES: DUF4167 domain-containing protein [unclassified Mesorhizobium]|uniref:DUF4167 domain-containing protein n=1 Tax=unclassified Mesorhizobium TaxID=325217 RepID=UPI001FDEF6D7|nr:MULTISPECIES: DUF4167 domain-containing protein [unclassified Mesorhizobium]
MRGRNNNGGGGGNNNNRKGPNPLTRTYESNGPDVKIRGSAQQIAEKYATLARDAQSSGDRVMAENYLQHAEHYNRIIAAAQAQMPIQNTQQNRDDFDDDLDEDRDEFDNAGNANAGDSQAAANGSGPQPVIEGTPAELAYNQENGRDNNNRRDNNQRDNNGRDRHRDRRNGGYGQYGQNSQRGENGPRGEHGGQQFDQNRRNETQAQPEASGEAGTQAGQAPQFDSFSPAALAAQAELNEAAMDNGGGRRPRRPRRPRGNYADQAGNGEQGDQPQSASPENSGEAHNAVNNGDEPGAKPAEEARPTSESVASEPVASEPAPVAGEASGEPVTADANN